MMLNVLVVCYPGQRVYTFSFSLFFLVAVDPYNALSTEQSQSEVISQWMNNKNAAVESGKAAEMSLSTSRSASSGTGQFYFSGSNPCQS